MENLYVPLQYSTTGHEIESLFSPATHCIWFPMVDTSTNMRDYEEEYATFRIEVPEFYNFGFDVIDRWADTDRNKLAMIWTNQQGAEKKFTFRDLKILSNQVANILLKYGITKGDRVLIMLPRIPEWWIMTLALIRARCGVQPGTGDAHREGYQIPGQYGGFQDGHHRHGERKEDR